MFGGDGASLAIPPEHTNLVSNELAKLIRFAADNFRLELRVAKIPAREIYDAGKELLVAKLEITSGRYISLFRGGGLDFADKLAKGQDQSYAITKHHNTVQELKGLSCRWSPIPATKGVIISLLVVARGPDIASVYQNLINKIREILACSIEDANPISLQGKQYKSFWKAVTEERKYHKNIVSYAFIKRLLDIALSVLIFRYRLNPVFFLFNPRKYKNSIANHSDYRKFDDTLRLIVDCRDGEYQQLNEELEQAYLRGQLFYGLHASKEALMTCFVESTQQGEHLHFIDGGDGGLAIASKQLKSQFNSPDMV